MPSNRCGRGWAGQAVPAARWARGRSLHSAAAAKQLIQARLRLCPEPDVHSWLQGHLRLVTHKSWVSDTVALSP